MGLANNNVTVTFASPTPGQCTPSSLASLTTILNTLVSADVTATGNTSFYNFGDTEPSAENRIYPWLKTILGYPDNWYVYVDGDWRPVNPSHVWYCGSTAGAADAYTATTVNAYPSLTTLTVGDLFIASINVSNTGATTLAMNGLAAAPVTIGLTPLVGGELVANSTYIFVWDGTRFRLLNGSQLPPEAVTVAQFVYQETSGTAAVAIAAGTTTIPFGTTLQSQTWASLGGGGAVTIQEGTYQITATLSIADEAGTSGGNGQLAIQDSATDLNWQDFKINNVDDTTVVTCIANITIPAAGTASITAEIFLSPGGSAEYGVSTTSARAERPASLTIMKLPQ
jgi:hypothetical protein